MTIFLNKTIAESTPSQNLNLSRQWYHGSLVQEGADMTITDTCNKIESKFKFKFNILFPCHLMYKHTYMAIKHKK